jgi:dihydrofolate synthase / folylpolyglutamate synthase
MWQAMIDRLYAISTSGMNLGLERVAKVLAALGHPELRYPSIHIAGTNGKGSTSAFIAAILGASGRKTGLYTSPHLVSLEERIQVLSGADAAPLSEGELLRAFEAVDTAAPGFAELSFFEVITAAGLYAFSQTGLDVAVVEAGIGARLDATRLVDAHVSVLTDLSLEHTAILGSTIEAIAQEKAAVIRAGRPIVAADAPPEAMAAIEAEASAQRAPLFRIGRELFVDRHPDGTYRFTLPDRTLDRVRLSLLGPHQGRNAVLALQAALQFDPKLDEAVIRLALASTRWPGRMEVVRRAGRPPVLLDGAHNPQGAEALARGLAAHPELFSTPRHLVFAVLGDKDAGLMLDHLLPAVDSVILTKVESPRAKEPSSILELIPKEKRALTANVTEALAEAERRAQADGGWVIFAGSLYLVGEARLELTLG